MSTDNNDMCANCGKGEEGSSSLKKCGACMSVRYCRAACQKAHRPQHKKECMQRAAAMHDEILFKQPPTDEDCSICFLRLPSMSTGSKYMSCCGKIICSGCIHAGALVGDDHLCPFCRTPVPTSHGEANERVNKRIEVGDPVAMLALACDYQHGDEGAGMPQDYAKALELWHRAAQLGYTKTYYNIGNAYWYGRGVEKNEKKAVHYWELAAIRGDVDARLNLGAFENNAGNYDRAIKHFMIAAGGGRNDSLKMIQQMYMTALATKDDYAKALRVYQAYLDEIKSDDRDKAAAYADRYKYM